MTLDAQVAMCDEIGPGVLTQFVRDRMSRFATVLGGTALDCVTALSAKNMFSVDNTFYSCVLLGKVAESGNDFKDNKELKSHWKSKPLHNVPETIISVTGSGKSCAPAASR